METLQAAGVPAGVVQSARDVLENDPHLKARGYYVYQDHPEAGRTAYDGPGFRLSKTPGRLQSPAPMLGEHTAQVCTEVLGMDDEEMAQLVMESVLF
jgi:benzylsuccinate CoA-transferase BbsF subunit